MFDKSDLSAAVAANILDAAQAAKLEAFLISRRDHQQDPTATGQENLRFLSNFNDIFITLGLVILFTGLTSMMAIIAGPTLVEGHIAAGVLSALALGGFAWILLEYFCGRRRLLLPSMLLTLIFVGLITTAVCTFVAYAMGGDRDFGLFDIFGMTGRLGITGFMVAAAAALLVYSRFRLPFSLAIIALSLAGAVYLFLGFFGELGWIVGGLAFFFMGLVTLGVAVWYDMQDPHRLRKASDNAFWLHLAAAPQIIIGISTMVTGSNVFAGTISGADHVGQGLTLLCVLLAIGIISLALNRRALIAASLITFIVTLSFVLAEAGLDASNIFILVTIIIGSGVVLLGAGWKTARKYALVFFPKGHTWDRIFPPQSA